MSIILRQFAFSFSQFENRLVGACRAEKWSFSSYFERNTSVIVMRYIGESSFTKNTWAMGMTTSTVLTSVGKLGLYRSGSALIFPPGSGSTFWLPIIYNLASIYECTFSCTNVLFFPFSLWIEKWVLSPDISRFFWLSIYVM